MVHSSSSNSSGSHLLTPGELERSRKVYQQLGLRDFAPSEEVKKAYRELALLHHPDKNPTDPEAINRFRLINEAYQILSDETKRKKYDSALQSAQATHSLYGGGIGIPTSARQAAAMNNNNNSSNAADGDYHHGGSVPTPQQFRDQMNAIPKRRHPSSNNMGNRNSNNNNTSGDFTSTASPTSPTPNNANNTSSAYMNDEFKRKEKARFAEMKRRLESERAQQQEAEFQRLQKQQNEQRREQQRRQREQERIRGKLDKALQQGSNGGGGSTTNLQSAPFQRVGSSQNVGNSSSNNNNSNNTPMFRSASSNNRGMNTKTINLAASPQRSAMARSRSATNNNNNIALLPDYNNNNNNSSASMSNNPQGSHSHSKHSTFATSFGTRRSMSPLGSPTPGKRVKLQETNANTPTNSKNGDQDSNNKNDTPPPFVVSPTSARRRPLDSTNASPEMIEMTRRQIEKDIENIPIEEGEEREHFLKLQERHERALMISKFKQEGIEIETEVRFRDFYDQETNARYAIDCSEVVERSNFQLQHVCFMKMHELLKEASRQGHGIFAWHENIWAHMKQNLQRLLLIAEREQLQRTAVIEEQEKRDSAPFLLHASALSRKFRVSAFEEDSARQTLYTQFYQGARAIEASRKLFAECMQPMYREEGLARERLAVELEEVVTRGRLYTAHAERNDHIVHNRTSAISAYINELNVTIAGMKDKVANHESVVAKMTETIDMHKKDNEREREEHEHQIAMMNGDMEVLESTIAKLRKELLAAEEKIIEEATKYEKLMDDKKQLEKKFSEVRLTVAMEHEAELKKFKEEAEKKENERMKELTVEKGNNLALQEKFDKLKGKHSEAAEFLREMMERDEKQRAEIEELRKEVMMMRDLDEAEGGNDNSDNNYGSSNTNTTTRNASRGNSEGVINNNNDDDGNVSERSSSQVSVFEVQQQQQNQKSSSPSSSAATSTMKGNKSTPGGLNQTPSSTGANKPSSTTANKNANNNNNNAASPGGRNISSTPQNSKINSANNNINSTGNRQQVSSGYGNNNNHNTTPDSSANRHTRSARLEQRLYTAAAAASAASIAMVQREGGIATNKSSSKPSSLVGTPQKQIAGNNTSSKPQQNAPSSVGRPPLSPGASAKNTPRNTTTNNNITTPSSSSSTSKQQQVAGNNNNNNNNSTQNQNNNQMIHQDPHVSYRELSAQARPRTVKQVVEWEEEDAAAVAQRAAVAAFLQKQQGGGALSHDYSDDPKHAQIHVRSPVPGRGILEYAGIKDRNNNKDNTPDYHNNHRNGDDDDEKGKPSSSSSCTSCDINNEALSKLVTTSDKLLLRNSSLVDDNETLAHAVVAMNQQREKSVAVANK